MSSAIATGLFSIGGVVVGGTLTAAITEHRERRRAQREARMASKVASTDLEHALEAIENVKESLEKKGQWPPGWDRVDWTESWLAYREMLVEGLADPNDFEKVARAFGSLKQLERGLASVHAEDPDDQKFLAQVERRINAAREILPTTRDDTN